MANPLTIPRRSLLLAGLVAGLLTGLAPMAGLTAQAAPSLAEAEFTTPAAQANAEELLAEIKLALFDRKWREARDNARRLQDRFPNDRRFAQAVYYEAEALKGLERREDALKRYEAALESRGDGLNSTLREEANLSVIDLAVELWQQGERAYIGRVLQSLGDANPRVRYFSALRLSYVDDKDLARRSVPVLNEIRDREEGEIRDRAYLALLRIDPRLVRSDRGEDSGKGLLRITMEADGEEMLSLSFPLSLARALLHAIPREAKEELRRNGIENADQLLEELMNSRAKVLEFRSSEGHFRIWIE
ncbi:MAG TPA: hypothetical protein VLV83_15420 [Acidobacteriota bacterium]|nr:hypothetical protein [Acidobacteriota bacterium]